MPSYRIRDWDKHFETPESRKLKFLKWVAVPNKTDGEGYTLLVDHPNGAAHLGAWYAIVETASRQVRPRGTLPAGIPPDFAGLCRSLGRISRLPSRIFEEALPRLMEIGWIECFQEDTEISWNLPESAGNMAAHNITLHNKTTTTTPPQIPKELPPPQTAVIQHEYPETLATIREHDSAADPLFCVRLADTVARAILSHPVACQWPPGKAEKAVSDGILARACRESYSTPGRKKNHGTGLLLTTVPNIVIGGKTNYV